jgi:hypothetical protein
MAANDSLVLLEMVMSGSLKLKLLESFLVEVQIKLSSANISGTIGIFQIIVFFDICFPPHLYFG